MTADRTSGSRLPRVPPLTADELAEGFVAAGLRAGDVALVHSALRTFGAVEGGAPTVVDALLLVLGPTGTLVAPTFTFAHEAEAEPIIDQASDRSEMGAITEAVRRHPLALRSTAFRHSFAAIGPRAEVIARVDERLAPFDLRSSFGVMLALDTQVALLGVTYASSTSHHFAEWVCEVPYRHTVVRHVRVRRPDGRLVRRRMVDYQPRPSSDGTYYGSRGADFNRLGRLLEERGRVGIAAVGNAIVRRFAMRDLVDLARREAALDANVFRTAEGDPTHVTALADGQFARSEVVVDGAGRPGRHLWSVVDPGRIFGATPRA
jgi:aminoglycoside 3-N-acetyltransferase